MNAQPEAESLQLPWTVPGWQAEVEAWILATLARLGRPATGPVEWLHMRPWSAMARAPSAGGDVYFKAPSPDIAFEPALLLALARWRPDCMLPVLAVDLARGLILTADAGVTLRSLMHSPDDLRRWHDVLPLYAGVQIEMIDRVPDLLALGMPDRRPEVLPELYARLLEDRESLLVGRADGLTPEQYARLLDGRPRVAALCARLAGYGVPGTLAHEELHDANVLAGPGGYVFADWGDASVGHPFVSLLVMLRSLADRLGLEDGAPELLRLRDVYLESWAPRFGTHADLRAAFDLAYRAGMLVRALSWHAALTRLPAAARAQHAYAVPAWLQDFLDAGPLDC